MVITSSCIVANIEVIIITVAKIGFASQINKCLTIQSNEIGFYCTFPVVIEDYIITNYPYRSWKFRTKYDWTSNVLHDQFTKLKKSSIDSFPAERVIALNQVLIIHHNRFIIIHQWKIWDTYSMSIAHSGHPHSLEFIEEPSDWYNAVTYLPTNITWSSRNAFGAIYFRIACVAYVALQ